MPAWGLIDATDEPTDDDPNWFEWPTEELLYQMGPDVHLQSIEFRDYNEYYPGAGDNLAYVKVNLSNG